MSCPKDLIILISCMVLLSVQSSNGSEIIGGTEVPPHSMPYMALLEYDKPFCGGTLINPSWVLTAAHCGLSSRIKRVLLGVHSISKTEKKSLQVQKVKKQVPHPRYDRADKVNDLMLLKLEKNVKKTQTVKWLNLGNTVKDPTAGSSCVVAGWGATNNVKKELSDVLMAVNVTVIEREICNSKEYYNLKPVITSSMVCAGSNGKNNADTCQGDSGGPLLCNGAIVGVTSFGEWCGKIKKPGVYAFLSEKQLNWIKTTMKKYEI